MPANDTVASTALQQYLNRLDSALARVPENERREILLETRSHVAEQARRSPMLSVPEILTELGEPEVYARTFMGDGPATPAARRSALHAIARLATGSWTRLPLLVFVLSCYSVAIFALFVAVNDVIEPATTGFYVEGGPTDRAIFFTISGPPVPEPKPDRLGIWLAPVMLSIALLIHLAMSAMLRRLLPRDSDTRGESTSLTSPRV